LLAEFKVGDANSAPKHSETVPRNAEALADA